ncbi:hypothetical protein MTO96_024802 [Rhipicephalus appendiculatus]
MISLRVIGLLCCLAAVNCVDYETEDSVLILKESNFEQAIKDHKHLFVLFYSLSCWYYKTIALPYDHVAKQLEKEGSDIKLAKVHGPDEFQLIVQHARGCPTLTFFRDGQPLEYEGGPDFKDMILWLKKKTGPPAQQLTTIDVAKAFVDSEKVAVVGFFKDQTSDEAKEFLKAADAADRQMFAITSDDAVYRELGANKDGVMLFKKFDEGKNTFFGKAVTSENIQKFVHLYGQPRIVDFRDGSSTRYECVELAASRFFEGSGKIRQANLLIFSKKSDDSKEVLENFREAAAAFRHQVGFQAFDIDNPDFWDMLDYFDLERNQVPAQRFVKLGRKTIHFKPETNSLKAKDIKTFVQGVLYGTIKPDLVFQELPDDWDKHPVKVVVQKNFDEVVFDKTKDVVVKFYEPWRDRCNHLAAIYDALAEKYKDRKDLLIVKIDATANEFAHTVVDEFPTFQLYKKDTNRVVRYHGWQTLKGLSKFIEANVKYRKANAEVVEEEKEEVKEQEQRKAEEVKDDEQEKEEEEVKGQEEEKAVDGEQEKKEEGNDVEKEQEKEEQKEEKEVEEEEQEKNEEGKDVEKEQENKVEEEEQKKEDEEVKEVEEKRQEKEEEEKDVDEEQENEVEERKKEDEEENEVEENRQEKEEEQENEVEEEEEEEQKKEAAEKNEEEQEKEVEEEQQQKDVEEEKDEEEQKEEEQEANEEEKKKEDECNERSGRRRLRASQ